MVDHETRRVAQAPRAQAPAVAVTRADEQVGVLCGVDDLALDAAVAVAAGDLATVQPAGGGGEQVRGGVLGESLHLVAGVAPGPAASEQSGEGPVGGFGDIAAGDVQQRDAGISGGVGAGGVDGGLPGALGDPHEHGHAQPPIACSIAHSATVAATSVAGTVSRPSRVKSPRSASVSCSRRMRRHSRVASDPA